MNGAEQLIAISVGNTRTRLGRFDLFRAGDRPGACDGLAESTSLGNEDLPGIVSLVATWSNEGSSGTNATDADQPQLVMASVNADVSERLASALQDQLSRGLYHVGSDLPVPIGQELDPETLTGVDRLLNAAAAFETVQQACIIVDAGTAVTVDFVDGQGTFLGGAIAPGARLQLQALHEHTAALPDVEFRRPESDPCGRSTADAILHGVFHGIRGMVWRLVEQYAESYGAYPIVVATGGDAAILFENDELVDRIVPDLTLLGISATVRHALNVDGRDADVTG